MIKFSINTNIKDVIDWVTKVPNNIVTPYLVERIAIIFRDRARQKILSSGALQQNANRFANSIQVIPSSPTSYRIIAGYGGDNQLVDDMYYLEFGTGIIGQQSSHPQATEIGWIYNVNEHSSDKGWTFRRNDRYKNKDTFIAKDDIIHQGKKGEKNIQSFGVIAIRYFYDTILEFDSILSQAINEIGD